MVSSTAPQLPPLSPSLASPILDSLDAIMPYDYDKQSYWHDRFTSESSYEWLLPSEEFMRMLEPILSKLPTDAPILHLGFGTSDLHNHFRSRGFTNVLNVDYEPLAVSRGQDLERKQFGDVKMRYSVQDITQLSFDPKEKFRLVVDKGAVDAVACGGDDLLGRTVAGVRKWLSGPDAEWVSLSYSASRFEIDGSPFNTNLLEKIPTPKLKSLDPDIFYYCYHLLPKRVDQPPMGL